MIRLTLSLAIWLGIVAVVPAALTPRKDARPTARKRTTAVDRLGQPTVQVPAKPALLTPSVEGPESEFLLTAATVVLLDGKPCRYEEVPAQASILRMEVAPDRKTVIRVFFGTRKQ